MNIILDLDCTLICTYEHDDINPKEAFEKLKIYSENVHLREKVYHFTLEKMGNLFMWGVFRPHVFTFLRWAHETFDNVIIWSAGCREYVKAIIKALYKSAELNEEPSFVYFRDQCKVIKKENGKRETVKFLPQLFDNEIVKSKGITAKNTLLIDDNISNKKHNQSNTIHISAYEPKFDLVSLENDNDEGLLTIIDWYENCPRTSNITRIVKPRF